MYSTRSAGIVQMLLRAPHKPCLLKQQAALALIKGLMLSNIHFSSVSSNTLN